MSFLRFNSFNLDCIFFIIYFSDTRKSHFIHTQICAHFMHSIPFSSLAYKCWFSLYSLSDLASFRWPWVWNAEDVRSSWSNQPHCWVQGRGQLSRAVRQAQPREWSSHAGPLCLWVYLTDLDSAINSSCHPRENFPDGHTVWQRKRRLQASCSRGPGLPPKDGASPIACGPGSRAAQRILKDGGLLPSFFWGDILPKRLGPLYLPERYQKRSESNELGLNICHSQEDLTMDRGAWQATVHGVARVRHALATQPPPPPSYSRIP